MIEVHRQIIDHLDNGADYDTISVRMNIPRELVADRVRNARMAQLREIQMMGTVTQRPPSIPRKRFVQDRFTADNICILSDLEIPDHSLEYLTRAVQISKKMGIRHLLIAGDVVAFDQHALTTWAKEYHVQDDPSIMTVVDLTEALLYWLFDTFDTIKMSVGNHDARLAKTLAGQVNFGDLLRNLPADQFEYINNRKVIIDTSRGPVWVIHPNGGGQAAKVAQDWYNNHVPKGHIVMPHFHVQCDTTTSDGQYEIHAIGTGRDSDLTEYKALGAWRGRAWDSSFLIIRNGYFYPFNLKNTDWDFWLNL